MSPTVTILKAPPLQLLQPLLLALLLLLQLARPAHGAYSTSSLLVVRVGDGVACPSSSAACTRAAPLFLDEIDMVSGALLSTQAIPGATLSANDQYVGALSRCGNGACVVFGAQADGAGTAATAASPYFAGSRIVVRIGASGAADTSTRLSLASYNGLFKGVCSLDGSGFWVAGNSTTGCVSYVAFGSSANTIVSAGAQCAHKDGHYTGCTAVASPAPRLFFTRTHNNYGFIDQPAPRTQSALWTTSGRMTVEGVASGQLIFGSPYYFSQMLTNGALTKFWAIDPYSCSIASGTILPTESDWAWIFSGSWGNPGALSGMALSPDESKLFFTAHSTLYWIPAAGASVATVVATASPFYEFRGVAFAPQTCSASGTIQLSGWACPGGASSIAQPCAPGSYAAAGAASCSPCTAGHFSNAGAASCAICDAGTYSASSNAAMCTACPPGTASAATGAQSSATCAPCTPGYSSLSGAASCTICGAGTYSASSNATMCTMCPPGTASAASGAQSPATCAPCEPGYYSSTAGSLSCSTCAAGTFSTVSGATVCTPRSASGIAASCGGGTSSDPNICISTAAGKLPSNGLFVSFSQGVAVTPDGLIVFSSATNLLAVTPSGVLVNLAGGAGSSTSTVATDVPVSPSGVAVGPDGTMYFADTAWHVIRRVDKSGATSVVAGTLGASGASGDGGAAVSAMLNNPSGIAIATSGDILIADNNNHAIRVVRASTGIISTIAGTLGVSGASGDGGPAISATLYYPFGIAIAASGDIVIADTSNNAIRVVRASTGIISTIAGTLGVSGASGDGGPAVSATLRYPYGVAIAASGDIVIADTGNNAIRVIPMDSPPVCPAGFFCSISRNLAPCTSPATYCPTNVAAPLFVDAGYAAVGESSPFAPSDTIFFSQRFCPTGSFCPPSAGVTTPCFSGSFGTSLLATSPADCPQCAVSTYLAEAGRTALAAGSSPCLPCPAGSFASSPGSTFCSLCTPSTFRAAGASNNSCSACPRGTASLYGASSCFALDALDALSLASGSVSFQRLIAVSSGNVPAPELLKSTLHAGLPVLALALLPYLLLSLASGLPRAIARTMRPLLERVDSYKIREPEAPGASPYLQPSPLGGALTLASVGLVAFLMISTVVQYAGSNTLLQQSTLPMLLPGLASFKDLPLAHVSSSAAAGLDDAALLALTGPVGAGSGFAITVATMGTRCGALRGGGTSGFSASLASGAFSYSSHFNSSTGAALHSFSCARCFVDELSQLAFALDASCQSLLVTVAAASAGGGVSSSSIYVTNAAAPGQTLLASVTATIPLALEVIQDGVGGATPRDSDGLVLGGRSAAGLVALAATSVASTQAATALDTGTLTLTLSLPVQTAYTLYALSPILSLLALFSSLAAWLTLLGVGAIVLDLHERGEKLGRHLGLISRTEGGNEGERAGSAGEAGAAAAATSDEHGAEAAAKGADTPQGRLVLRRPNQRADAREVVTHFGIAFASTTTPTSPN